MNADTDANVDGDATGDANADVDVDAHTDVDVDLDFGEDGLVPVVAQDADSGDVLMLAYATRDAVEQSAATGRAHYYSRSRDELWEKGATSGHTQEIQEIRVDCDGDALLYLVEQDGGACHTGHRSCFYRTVEGEHVGEKVFEPDDVY